MNLYHITGLYVHGVKNGVGVGERLCVDSLHSVDGLQYPYIRGDLAYHLRLVDNLKYIEYKYHTQCSECPRPHFCLCEYTRARFMKSYGVSCIEFEAADVIEFARTR